MTKPQDPIEIINPKMVTNRYCFTLDLNDNAILIQEYEACHLTVWSEIIVGIKSVGILDMQIFRWETRMVMTVDVPEGFDLDTAFAKLATMPRQDEWEALMWKFQKELVKGEKWVKMDNIFRLNNN